MVRREGKLDYSTVLMVGREGAIGNDEIMIGSEEEWMWNEIDGDNGDITLVAPNGRLLRMVIVNNYNDNTFFTTVPMIGREG